MFAVSQRGRQTDRGQALIIFTFSLVMLMGIAALSIDVGMAFREKGQQQQAADAAALAAADVLYNGGTQDAAVAAATSIATANGYTDGVHGAEVTVNIPPPPATTRG